MAAYTLTAATEDDISGIIDVKFACWPGQRACELFPRDEEGRRWLSESTLLSIRDPNTALMIITSPSPPSPSSPSSTKTETRPVHAFARFIHHPGGSPAPSWTARTSPAFPPGVTKTMLGPGFYEKMERQHERVMGEKPHLSTLPTHQKQGLASLLLAWGAAHADAITTFTPAPALSSTSGLTPSAEVRVGVETYLDATVRAVPLYERHGFVARHLELGEGEARCVSVPMVRPAGGEGGGGEGIGREGWVKGD